MSLILGQRILFFSALFVLCGEVVSFYYYHEYLLSLGEQYLWAAPLLFFKSFFKKLLILNFFGMAKMLLMIFWHVTKLLLIKLLKTIGIRYGTYFSQNRWQKTSQYFRVFTKRAMRQGRSFRRLVSSLSQVEFVLVVIAFLPVFLLLFLFGIGFRMTRDVMVKKGSEIGVTNVAVKTAKKSRGLVARLRQIDGWLLQKIESLTGDARD